MAQCKAVQFQNSPDGGGMFCFGGVDPGTVAQDVQAFFTAQGYRLESGTPLSGTYGMGSDVLRTLFGGFVNRYKFSIVIQPQDQYVWLKVAKGMSGMMGGAWGYSKMKKETARIMQVMQARFA